MDLHRNSRSKNIGVIGLGIIGSRVAAGLRSQGWNAFVWNRTPKPVPNFLGSAAEVARTCEIIQLFVADAPATMEMIEAMKDALTPEHVVLCHGTIGLEGTLEAARRVQQTGAHFLDAPFTGSKIAAEKRQLCYYIGGDEQTAAAKEAPGTEAAGGTRNVRLTRIAFNEAVPPLSRAWTGRPMPPC
jgi:3-hydroxyisobutyrate dehydrogenase-like beta-hydroxyacid dehydrogenase